MAEERKRYLLRVSERQLAVIQKSLEEYFRLRMGRDYYLSDEMAEFNIDLSPDNPEHEEMLDRFLQKQNSLNALMQTYFEIAFGPLGHAKKTEDMLIAQDIWDSIRTCRGINRMNGCIHTSSEPLPDIRAEEP